MAKEKRISLTEANFKTLIAGKTVEQDGVKIILQDIGWFYMKHLIDKEIVANAKRKLKMA